MSYQASVYRVMIATPGDVQKERDIIRKIIQDWNDLHSKNMNIALMPIGWDTHSSPEMGDRPQAIINKQILHDCDLLVAVFWTRVGTPTGEEISGTVEEIKKHIASGKRAMIYFSDQPVKPSKIENRQYKSVREFRSKCQKEGMVESFNRRSEFEKLFTRQLADTIQKFSAQGESRPSAELKSESSPAETAFNPIVLMSKQELAKIGLGIGTAAHRLLSVASKDLHKSILYVRSGPVSEIQTSRVHLQDKILPGKGSVFQNALEKLVHHGLVSLFARHATGGDEYRITQAGSIVIANFQKPTSRTGSNLTQEGGV